MSSKSKISLICYPVFFLMLLLFSNCSKKNEEIYFQTDKFSGGKSILYIYGKKDETKRTYLANIYLWIDGREISDSAATFFLKDKIYYLQISNNSQTTLKLFDLNKFKNEIYLVNDDKTKLGSSTTMIFEDSKRDENGKMIYKFRLKNGFKYYKESFDVVFIVGDYEGVIGSYFSIKDNGIENIASPLGRMFDEINDTTKFNLVILR